MRLTYMQYRSLGSTYSLESGLCARPTIALNTAGPPRGGYLQVKLRTTPPTQKLPRYPMRTYHAEYPAHITMRLRFRAIVAATMLPTAPGFIRVIVNATGGRIAYKCRSK
jgi:hypothetical protein